MADQEQVKILRQGWSAWNSWRRDNPYVRPDLSAADLSSTNLSDCDLRKADLRGAVLRDAQLARVLLWHANLQKSDLRNAVLEYALLWKADLTEAKLADANLIGAQVWQTNLTGADLDQADLRKSHFVEVNLTGARLNGCKVYGIAAWNVTLDGATQSRLLITRPPELPISRLRPHAGNRAVEPPITVDNLEVAQFVYLLLYNKTIRKVIDTIGEKAVLILGRFTGERKAVLDAIRSELGRLGFVPIMFDFDRPAQRDFTETVKTLAGLSRFIIADITNPKSTPLELQATMPDYMIPFVPIIQESEEPFAMFRDLRQKYGAWVLDVLKYDSPENLIKVLERAVVRPALAKGEELLLKKAEAIRSRHVHEYL